MGNDKRFSVGSISIAVVSVVNTAAADSPYPKTEAHSAMERRPSSVGQLRYTESRSYTGGSFHEPDQHGSSG